MFKNNRCRDESWKCSNLCRGTSYNEARCRDFGSYNFASNVLNRKSMKPLSINRREACVLLLLNRDGCFECGKQAKNTVAHVCNQRLHRHVCKRLHVTRSAKRRLFHRTKWVREACGHAVCVSKQTESWFDIGV